MASLLSDPLLSVTGAKVVAAETVTMQVQGVYASAANCEETYTLSSGSSKMSKAYIVVLRLYLDGVYPEPDPSLLPPPPTVIQPAGGNSGCCTLI